MGILASETVQVIAFYPMETNLKRRTLCNLTSYHRVFTESSIIGCTTT